MSDYSKLFTYLPPDARAERLNALHLQAIEHNPLDAADIAMLEMFDHEGWSDEEQIAHILSKVRSPAGRPGN